MQLKMHASVLVESLKSNKLDTFHKHFVFIIILNVKIYFRLNTDRELYDALLNSVKNGTSGDKHVAHLFLFDFEQSGIHLDEKPRERVVRLNDTILQTGQRFMASATSVRHVPKEIVPPHIRQQ